VRVCDGFGGGEGGGGKGERIKCTGMLIFTP
jgi:hypothetical protein